MRMGPRAHRRGHHKRGKNSETVKDTKGDFFYLFFANDSAKAETDVTLQPFTGKVKTELCETVQYCPGTYSGCEVWMYLL